MSHCDVLFYSIAVIEINGCLKCRKSFKSYAKTLVRYPMNQYVSTYVNTLGIWGVIVDRKPELELLQQNKNDTDSEGQRRYRFRGGGESVQCGSC